MTLRHLHIPGLAILALTACGGDSTVTMCDSEDGTMSSSGSSSTDAPTSATDSPTPDTTDVDTSDETGTGAGDPGSSTGLSTGESGASTDAATSSDPAPVCGDGAVDPGEACDDGNGLDTDACTNACKDAACGDGIVHDGVEACDDGNAVGDDTCTNICEVHVVKYSAVGPQLYVPQAALVGWTPCYIGNYGENTPTVLSVVAACTKANLMLACRPVGADSFRLLAHAPRADVLKDTGTSNTPTISNGSGWYFNDSWSWGFAMLGDEITRNSCDTEVLNGERRLCWHTNSGNLNSGYRCGTAELNDNEAWERVVLQAD